MWIECDFACRDMEEYLPKPLVGLLLRTNEQKVVLIGHVNEMGGLCDCCSRFRSEDERVVAYKRVYTPEE